jgi:BON domain
MRRLLRVLIAPVLAAMLALPAMPTTTHTAATASKSTPSDSQIDATIRAKLAKSKIGKEGFKFRVQRGVVTWEGSTAVMQHKGSATRMARTAGALQVVNNIQISDGARAKTGANLKKAQVSE